MTTSPRDGPANKRGLTMKTVHFISPKKRKPGAMAGL